MNKRSTIQFCARCTILQWRPQQTRQIFFRTNRRIADIWLMLWDTFLGIRHISVFGLFEWSQHHNLHLKRLQRKICVKNSKFKVFLSAADHIATTTLFANAADFGQHYTRLLWAEYSISSCVTNHDSQGSSILFAKKQKVYFKKNEEAELRVVFSSACQMLFLLYVTTRLHIKLWWKGVKIGMRG